MVKTKKKRPKNKRGNHRHRTPENPTRTIRTPENRKKILGILSQTGCSLTKAAVKCGIGETSAYEWQRDDDDFRKEVHAAMEGPGTDILEDVAMDHALNGVQEPVIFQGRLQYEGTFTRKVITSKAGKKRNKIVWEPTFDKNGKLIPLVVVKHDHGLLTRMLDRRRPVATLNKLDVGPGIEQLLDELNKPKKEKK